MKRDTIGNAAYLARILSGAALFTTLVLRGAGCTPTECVDVQNKCAQDALAKSTCPAGLVPRVCEPGTSVGCVDVATTTDALCNTKVLCCKARP